MRSPDALRQQMVDDLVARGALNDWRVETALRRVPRHRFVPRPVYDDAELAVLHDPDAAFGLKGTGDRLLSSLSAAIIVGSMAELLRLRPGLRVLEIGAGGGYNAAVLAELVGDGSLVTTVEIDPEVAAWARTALDAVGCGDVAVVTADGYEGVPARAPYDRIIATVGCTDVSPAWLDQLQPEGFVIVPLEHGGLHPLMEVAPAPGGRGRGALVGRSAFVRVQGTSDRPLAWPVQPHIPAGAERLPLPPELAIFRDGPGSVATEEAWSFHYYLALADRRTAFVNTLIDADRGGVTTDLRTGQVVRWGDPDIYDDLLAHVGRWRALGSPGLDRFVSTFTPRDEPLLRVPGPSWTIDRIDFRQQVSLTDAP